MNDALLTVDADDPTPPYEQLRRQLLELVEAGVLTGGSRLPPVRQLAGDLGLAPGTVNRAYRELESAGLLVTRRGGGTRVAESSARRSPESVLQEHATALVSRARTLGVDDAGVRAAIDHALRRAPHRQVP